MKGSYIIQWRHNKHNCSNLCGTFCQLRDCEVSFPWPILNQPLYLKTYGMVLFNRRRWRLVLAKVVKCDQIGRFLKFLCYKFCFKLSPYIWQPFRLFWSMSLFKKKLLCTSIGQFGLHLIPTSGRTGGKQLCLWPTNKISSTCMSIFHTFDYLTDAVIVNLLLLKGSMPMSYAHSLTYGFALFTQFPSERRQRALPGF